jgi:hypothetical protein
VHAVPPAVRPGRRARWLVLGGYLLSGVAVTWRLWADPAHRVQGAGDIDQFAWFMGYAAAAVAHGHLPALVTTAMNAPYGVNLMWNTSFLLPGVVTAPLTLLAGPQVSLTLVLTAGFAGSAAALYGVARRWGASMPAAALGGAIYGFSPALVRAGSGGYQLKFGVLLPLIASALVAAVTGRGGARCGIWLGLLMGAQLFISEEMLAVAVLAGTVAAAALAASRPRLIPRQARGAAAALIRQL